MTLSRIPTGLESIITLSDGVAMPMFGLGMSKSTQPKVAVASALRNGYKLIDTAVRYGNEKEVGDGVRESAVSRNDVFIVSKLWNVQHGYANCRQAVSESMERLGVDYVDLYLIHSPIGGRIVESYDCLLDLKAKGLIRSVGVSNFDVPHLEGLKASGRPLPSVNQIELHPWYRREEIVTWCLNHGVTVMGYSPLVKSDKMDDPLLLQIAEKYSKTPAQVLIRWSVQHGYITIPKSSNPDRIRENCQVFDWHLREEDIKALSRYPTYICAWDPTVVPWEG